MMLNPQRSQQLTQIVRAVQQVINDSWVPEDLRGKATWFGLYDFWLYEDEDADSECEYCKTYRGQLFAGNQIRSIFPDLEVISEDLVLPKVHTTLWGKDTCKCKLSRVPFSEVPAGFEIYSGERTPHYVWKPEGEGYYSYKKG